MKKPKITHDGRGFAIYGTIKDTRAATIVVKHSSADPLRYLWIFIDGGHIAANKGAAHLTLAQAKKVRDALTRGIQDISKRYGR
jgi:hypothetical protein